MRTILTDGTVVNVSTRQMPKYDPPKHPRHGELIDVHGRPGRIVRQRGIKTGPTYMDTWVVLIEPDGSLGQLTAVHLHDHFTWAQTHP